MPLNPNILALLRQGMTSDQRSNAPQGLDPNLEMILQGMGMMPRRLDMQGRPIVGGVENPSTMDQHYARQNNPDAMRQRYSAPTFAMAPNDPNRMAPATPLPSQGKIVAHQPVSGLPGQVGPAYSTQMTPINMYPSPTEGDAMDSVRRQYRQTMQQGRVQTQQAPAEWQGAPAPAMPQWQGPPMPDARTQMQNFQTSGTRTLDVGNPFVPSASPTPAQSTMDLREAQMPPNSSIPATQPVAQTPSIPEWQGAPYVNPVAKHLSQLGASALQQYPMLNAFAPPIPQSAPPRVDTSAGSVFDMLRKRSQGALGNAQAAFGSLAPPRPTPSPKGSVWDQLRRQGNFGR